jgi:hypothetical protein
MIRLIVAAALVVAVTASYAQQGGGRDPQKLEKCRQLATQRGFTSGPQKGANGKRGFVRDCMHGKVS